jgi:transposase-like protein
MAYAYARIQETITYACRRCGNPDIVKNGTNKCGSPQDYCHVCGAHRTLVPKRSRAAQFKSLILKTYPERATRSVRGLERIFQVSRQTVAHWLRTILRTVPKFKQTVLPAQPVRSWNWMNCGHLC